MGIKPQNPANYLILRIAHRMQLGNAGSASTELDP
jgi:hypothetical protein